jgi:hypothetical protein
MSWTVGRWILLYLIFSVSTIEATSQTSATVSLEKALFNAGETIQAVLTFDVPSPCPANVGVYLTKGGKPFGGTPGTDFLILGGQVEKGQSKLTISYTLPFDSSGGEFELSPSISSYLLCSGYSHQRKFALSDPPHITVLPVVDTNLYPTQAKVELTVSQKQFLETKANELDGLLVDFANGIQQYAAATDDQKKFLVSIIDQAQSALDATERAYKQQILKPNEQIPVFFEDFRENYQHLEIEIKAPKTSQTFSLPNLVYVQVNTTQLKKRTNRQPIKPSTTLTPDARATQDLIGDNKKAYKYVEDTGGAVFTTALMSIPDSARVSYKRTTQMDFMDYPTPTNVTVATFPMAYLLFKFHKDNCGEDQFLRINPWDDPHATIKMEFTKCH